MKPGRPEASAVIWDWESSNPLGDSAGPTAASMRVRGVLQGAAALVVAGVFFYFGHLTVAKVAAGVGAFFALTALLSPLGLFALIQRGNAALASWVGSLLNWIMLPFIFYLFFVPFGRLFRRGRRDTLKRFYEADAESYWIDRSSSYVSPSHEKQF